ncbi:MAG: histidinol-phosphate transaminase [Clostridia bacterium]|jgi:histidinol-phosphate aminotransferase
MNKFWSEIANSIEPYTAGEQPKDKKYIKLNTNENPYSPSVKVLDAIRNAANESLKLYPDPTCNDLKTAIAEYYRLDNEQIFIGNGSDEILAFSFMAFFNPKEKVLFPDITYSFYPVFSDLFNIDYKCVPLDDEFNVQTKLLNEENGGIIISNPNAPTGISLPVSSIEEILKNNTDSVVIIDEAYIDFGGESAYKLINKYENLLVVQTFSKSRSLAGLRVGFAMGNSNLINALVKIKNSFNSYTTGKLALIGAIEAIKDNDYFEMTTKKIIKTREIVVKKLKEMGFWVLDSKANFIFISHPKVNAEKLFIELRSRGILVRYFSKKRIDNFIRISMGEIEDMERFIYEINDII